jgi:phosphatidylethanolamine-binding protein (PEBP) family uncharacterized protein
LAAQEFTATTSIALTSPAFADGEAIPRLHAGAGVGDDVSPELHWTGVPAGTRQLALFMDDVDVPLPKPLFHSIAILEPELSGVGQGEFGDDTTGLRVIGTMIGRHGYSGPRPIPGHGPHRYRFHLLALDRRVPDEITSAKQLLTVIAGHVLARGMLTGTYER